MAFQHASRNLICLYLVRPLCGSAAPLPLAIRLLLTALGRMHLESHRMNAPILICGARRSGTTLMMAVLCSDPRANSLMPECQILTRLVEAFQWSESRYEDFGAPLAGSKIAFEQMYSRWAAELLGSIRQQAGKPGVLILKHPAMLRCLNELQTLLPTIRPLIMVRDPRDQVASELEVASRRTQGPRPTVRALATRLAESFKAFDETSRVVVRYEDLVCDFAAVKSRIEATFELSLTFDIEKPWPDISSLDGMQKFPAWSPKYGHQIDGQGVGRYRGDLRADEIARVEGACEDYMKQFGYLPSCKQ